MLAYQAYLGFLLSHWRGAAGASVAFLLGAVAARFVVRHDLRPLMALPLWFLRRIAAILKRNPSVLALAAFIFTFNGTAMFVYMLFGLIPFMPAVIAFLTGMNVAIATLKSTDFKGDVQYKPSWVPKADPDGPAAGDPAPNAAEPNPFAILCSILVLALELPCFWFATALGAGMFQEGYWLGTLWQGENLADLQMRVMTFLLVILPILAISALAEGYAVKHPIRPSS